MKTIIIPTDFSPTAINAMNYGLDMARAIKARVVLFHVYNIPVTVTETPIVLVSVDELKSAAETQMRIWKQKVEHVASGEVTIDTETRLGDLIDELENLSETLQPFAIIMGTRGSSGIESIFGSNTISVIRHTRWPVIAVPSGTEYGEGIRKIGFACDLKNVAATTPASVINDIAVEFKAQLHVLNVTADSSQPPAKDQPELELLQNLLQEAKPVYDFIQHEDVQEGVSEFSEKNNLDLIIIIAKKHTFLQGLFKKSSTKGLVFHSHVPVMSIHE